MAKRDLTQTEIDWLNELEEMEAAAGNLLALLATLVAGDNDAQRWLSLARTYLETGFMYTIKAVARPTNGLGCNR